MFWVGSFITVAAKSLRHLEEPAQPPPQQQLKSLAELIAERKVRCGALLCMCLCVSSCMWQACMCVGAVVTCEARRRASSSSSLHQPRSRCVPLLPASPRQQAELQEQLAELQALPRTRETKQALATVRQELRQYRDSSASWWRWW